MLDYYFLKLTNLTRNQNKKELRKKIMLVKNIVNLNV